MIQSELRLRKSSLLITLAALVMATLSLSSCGSSSQSKENTPADNSGSALSRTVQSNFDVESYEGPTFTLKGLDGADVTFTDFLGKGAPVAVNFWGTWCAPCRRELPEFKRIYSEYKDKGVELIGVTLRDTPEKVINFTSREGITWPQVIGDYETTTAYGGITGVPTTIIYSSMGDELFRYVGPLPYEIFKRELKKAIENEANLST